MKKKLKINLRCGEGWEVKPEAEELDGKIYEFREGWTIEEGDSSLYVGEKAMLFEIKEGEPRPKIGWVASGDLIEVN